MIWVIFSFWHFEYWIKSPIFSSARICEYMCAWIKRVTFWSLKTPFFKSNIKSSLRCSENMFDTFTMQNRAFSGPSVCCAICMCPQKSVCSAELPAAVLAMWCIAAGSCSAWVLPAHFSWFLGDISPPSRLVQTQFPLPQICMVDPKK